MSAGINPNCIDPESLEALRAQVLETTKACEDQLLSILSNERSHSFLKVRACIRLAHIGSEVSVEALERLTTNPALAKPARFAHMLICSRIGRLSVFIERHRAAELKLEGPTQFLRSYASSLENLAISPALEELGIGLSRLEACATSIRSGKTRLLILRTREAVEHGFLNLSQMRPALLGALLQYDDEHRFWGIRSYFLGAPLSAATWIGLVRNDGEIEMAGYPKDQQVLLKSLECAGAMPAHILIHAAGTDLFVTGLTALRRANLGKAVPFTSATGSGE